MNKIVFPHYLNSLEMTTTRMFTCKHWQATELSLLKTKHKSQFQYTWIFMPPDQWGYTE